MKKDTIQDENVMEKFQEWQKTYSNPLTSDLRRFSVLKNGVVVEFSQNTSEDYYGITVLKYAPNYEYGDFKSINSDLNRPFRDLEHAQAYYDALRVFIGEVMMETVKNAESEDIAVEYSV